MLVALPLANFSVHIFFCRSRASNIHFLIFCVLQSAVFERNANSSTCSQQNLRISCRLGFWLTTIVRGSFALRVRRRYCTLESAIKYATVESERVSTTTTCRARGEWSTVAPSGNWMGWANSLRVLLPLRSSNTSTANHRRRPRNLHTNLRHERELLILYLAVLLLYSSLPFFF